MHLVLDNILHCNSLILSYADISPTPDRLMWEILLHTRGEKNLLMVPKTPLSTSCLCSGLRSFERSPPKVRIRTAAACSPTVPSGTGRPLTTLQALETDSTTVAYMGGRGLSDRRDLQAHEIDYPEQQAPAPTYSHRGEKSSAIIETHLFCWRGEQSGFQPSLVTICDCFAGTLSSSCMYFSPPPLLPKVPTLVSAPLH